jgi:hypothetical protein
MRHLIYFPDWNSIESVRHAHASLELWAIIFFGLLVVLEAWEHLLDENHPLAKKIARAAIFSFAIAVLL